MRGLIGLTVLALAAGGSAAAAAPGAVPSAKPALAGPARPVPAYVVVQGAHTRATDAVQELTVFCPSGHHALGGGYSALMQMPPKTPGGAPGQAESGLDNVRSVPNMTGTGWQVSGAAPDAIRLKQPWQLVVRVVCMPVPS
jgi:hypothetical protein